MNDMSWSAGDRAMPSPAADGDHPRREMIRGGAIAFIFFVGLLGAAATIPLDAGASADGVIAVSGSRQAVQHREGGIVTNLRVSEGQYVRKNDVLLTISAPEAVATERGLSGDQIAILAQRARLLAERDGLGSVPQPPEFAALAPQDQPLASEAMTGQRLLFHARRNSLRAETDVLGQRIAQHSRQIGGVTHQMASNREQQRLISDEIDGLRSLVPQGFVAINRLRATERAAAELDGNYGAYRADAARIGEAIGETRLQMLTLRRQRLEEVATQLRELHIRLSEITPKLAAVREQLARSTVRAPSGGRVVGLKIFTVGGVVAAGDLLMEIVPDDKGLVIQGRIAPTDADDLAPGMEMQVRFPAFQERHLPILKGRLTKISADGFEDERSGMRYFKVEAEVPPAELAKLEAARPGRGLSAGLPAQILIPLRKRTGLDYLLEPLSQSLWKVGREH